MLQVLFSDSYTIKPKLCINCKYFFKDSILDNNRFGKCIFFPTTKVDSNFYVTGDEKYIKKEYYYCSTARNSDILCGNDGLKYEKK